MCKKILIFDDYLHSTFTQSSRLVRMTAEFESNITSVERIKEYCETEHEVT